MIVVEKWQNHYSLQCYMMLMSKHCSSIYFRCQTTPCPKKN